MDTKIVTGDDIGALIDRLGVDYLMQTMLDELGEACAAFDPSVQQVCRRDGFSYQDPALGLVEWMPCMDLGRQISVKMVAYHPQNPPLRQLPTILSTVHLYDPLTGHLRGLIDGTFLTALRTGAASCIASRILARPDAQTVGMIGCGAQAVTQLHALALHFDLRQVLIYDVDAGAQASFVQRVQRLLGPAVEFKPAPIDLIVQSADLLVTATSKAPGERALFADLPTRPWLHINAIGSDFAGKVELPLSLLRRALVCPDDREQALREGECQQLDAEQAGPELWQLVQRADHYRDRQHTLTVFDSTGWAFEDQVAADLLLRLAEEHGLCQRVTLERITRDPLNPYDRQQRDGQSGPVERRALSRGAHPFD